MELPKILARTRIYIIRAMSYAGAIQFCMIIFLVTDKLQAKQIIGELTIKQSILLYVIALTSIVIFGYLEDKLGVLKEEQTMLGEKNKVLTRIEERLVRIEDKMKK